jgi:uncharacterized protein
LEPNLERLIRLQELSLAIEEVGRNLGAMPQRSQDLEQAVARHRADVAKAKDELAGLLKDRRKLEGDLAMVESRIAKYQGQLMEVKTNKEYTAMLSEIETVKGERGGIETRILQEMEAADALERSIREKEVDLAAEQKKVSAALEALAKERQGYEAENARLDAARKEVEAGLPRELVTEFVRISRGRGGLAVARVVAGLCQGCSVRIQPRIFQQVRRNEALIHCDSCKRYLYYVEEKRAESPTGA